MAAHHFTDWDVWKRAHQVALDVYAMTKEFPVDERFGLSLQMRKAAVSVPANIAEGFARRKPLDKARLYNIGEGSASELDYFLILAPDLKYVSNADLLRRDVADVSRMMRRLVEATLRALRE